MHALRIFYYLRFRARTAPPTGCKFSQNRSQILFIFVAPSPDTCSRDWFLVNAQRNCQIGNLTQLYIKTPKFHFSCIRQENNRKKKKIHSNDKHYQIQGTEQMRHFSLLIYTCHPKTLHNCSLLTLENISRNSSL